MAQIGAVPRWVCVTAEEHQAWDIPSSSKEQLKNLSNLYLPQRKILSLLSWSVKKFALCPRVRYYFCPSMLFAIQTFLKRWLRTKAVTGRIETPWRLSPNTANLVSEE